MFQSFIDYLKFEKRYSTHTIQSYETDLKQFFKFLNQYYGISEIKDIDNQILRTWLAELIDNGMSPKTVNRKTSAIKSFFRFNMRLGKISENPASLLQGPKQNRRLPVFVEESKMSKLFSFETENMNFEETRDMLILELLYSTGIRRAELIEIKIFDVNFSKNMVKVLGKRNKERILPLSEELIHKIEQYINLRNQEVEDSSQTDYLFITKKAKKLYPKLVYRIVNSYLSKVSTQDKKSPHVLRHTFATHMLNNGADLNAVKELLGHASLAATQIYTHNTIEKLKEVYKQAHPKA